MFDFGDLPEDDEVATEISAEAGDTSIFFPGDIVKGYFLRAQWYVAKIVGDNADGTYNVEWNDGDAKDMTKPISELKLVRRGPNFKETSSDAEKAAHEQAQQQAREQVERDAIERAAREQAADDAQRKAAEERQRAEAERAAKEEKMRSELADKEATERLETQRRAAEKEQAEREANAQAEEDRKALEAQATAERKAKEQEVEELGKKEAEKTAPQAKEEPAAAKPEAEDDDDDDDLPPLETEQGEPVTDGKVDVAAPANSESAQAKPTEPDASDVGNARKDAEEFAKEERERRQNAVDEQKKNAAYQRKERDKRVLERSGGRIAGARVKLKEMKEKPQMNGACGTLVEEKGERWIVNLDGCPGVGKGKWMVNRKNLLAAQWNCTEPKIPYSIVGSWNNWSPADMEWDADRQCWHFTVTVGDRGWESFQFISEHDPNKCVHPDQKDATPHMPHKMLGPDFEGHGQNWSVGKHPLDKGRKGAVFEVRLFVWEDEAPRAVEWSQPGGGSTDLPTPKGQKVDRFCIAGSWNNWTIKDMDWDEGNQHYHHVIQLTSQGWESFQIMLEGDYKKCMHPSIADANPYLPYTLCGPDNRGHGKNWTIGRHALDKGSKGAKYKVRFFPAVGGRAGLVDWEPVTGNSTKSEDSKTGSNGQKKRYCVAGTWGNWAANDMGWDEKRKCFHYTVKLGLSGRESFQILVDGNYKLCIHPDCSDATPHDKHEVLGPDSNGHGKNWTIGRHRLDLGSRGSRFEVRLYVDDEGVPRSVDWERVPTPGLGTKD